MDPERSQKERSGSPTSIFLQKSRTPIETKRCSPRLTDAETASSLGTRLTPVRTHYKCLITILFKLKRA